jgi:hypothetical protein
MFTKENAHFSFVIYNTFVNTVDYAKDKVNYLIIKPISNDIILKVKLKIIIIIL